MRLIQRCGYFVDFSSTAKDALTGIVDIESMQRKIDYANFSLAERTHTTNY